MEFGTARRASEVVITTTGRTRAASVSPPAMSVLPRPRRVHEHRQSEEPVHDRRDAGQVADVRPDEPRRASCPRRTPRGRWRRRRRMGWRPATTMMISVSEPISPWTMPAFAGLAERGEVRKSIGRSAEDGQGSMTMSASSTTRTPSDDHQREQEQALDDDLAHLDAPPREPAIAPPRRRRCVAGRSLVVISTCSGPGARTPRSRG